MQHLLLALSIITLTIIAGNDRRETSVDKSTMIMKIEKPKVSNACEELPVEEPSVYFSPFYLPLD